jgi:hypothetical protein
VTLRNEYTIGFDVTFLKFPAMFVSRHGLMSERSADDQWRHIFDDIMYQLIKGNKILGITCRLSIDNIMLFVYTLLSPRVFLQLKISVIRHLAL